MIINMQPCQPTWTGGDAFDVDSKDAVSLEVLVLVEELKEATATVVLFSRGYLGTWDW